MTTFLAQRCSPSICWPQFRPLAGLCPISSGKSFLTLCLFSYGRGEGAELPERWGEGLGLASGPRLPPISTGQDPGLAAPFLGWLSPGWGLGRAGWAAPHSQEEIRQAGNAFVTAQWSAQRWLQEELPLQEEGRRSAAHIRPCLFLPDAMERCPSHFVIAGRGLSFTLGLVPWRTLACRAGHTLRGTKSLRLALPGPPYTQARACGTKQPVSDLAICLTFHWVVPGCK